MLSGNGRHRRPRQAPALVVAAGVTGSAIAIPLLGASGASAADGAAWDRVAECATGGAWSENSGNGYYGGLQLSQEDWEKYGGLAYAASADQASRSQQISVAEKMLADQGIAAWPTCGLLAGLVDDPASAGAGAADGKPAGGDSGGSADYGNTAGPTSPAESGSPAGSEGPAGSEDAEGAKDSSEQSGSGDSSDSPETSHEASPETSPDSSSSSSSPSVPASPSAAPDDASNAKDGSAESGTSADVREDGGSPSVAPESDEADNSGQSVGTSYLVDTGSAGTGRHRGPSADEEAVEERGSASSGRHASRGDDAAREDVDGSYTVRSGDTLWTIADSLDLQGGWRALYDGNRDVVGADPNAIVPGQTLEIGAEPGGGRR
ncbi:transglycosylase family protein [Streptomyces sp. NPDC051041]|uniref:transglycosylase family protein n=1 Tax=Streptomyces sp. NPDC051041 TaxID=3365640 RepID=UPI0037A21EC0